MQNKSTHNNVQEASILDVHDENSPFDAIAVDLVWKKIQLFKQITVVNDMVNHFNILTSISFSQKFL